jgi:hypothetical protein
MTLIQERNIKEKKVFSPGGLTPVVHACTVVQYFLLMAMRLRLVCSKKKKKKKEKRKERLGLFIL